MGEIKITDKIKNEYHNMITSKASNDDFFPCNERESFILRNLSGDKLKQYIALRNSGKTLTEAIQATDNSVFQLLNEQREK